MFKIILSLQNLLSAYKLIWLCILSTQVACKGMKVGVIYVMSGEEW